MPRIAAIAPLPDLAVDRAKAEALFDLIAKFADYGFNRSHAAAYAAVSFQTAYLKRHFPHEFYAAAMNLELADVEKIAVLYADIRRHRHRIEAPGVQAGEGLFTVRRLPDGGKAVVWALSGIRGMGVDAADALVRERKASGDFRSLGDFVERCRGFLNKRGFEALIRAGACDALHRNRAAMLAGLDRLLKTAQKKSQDDAVGQGSLLAMFGAAPSDDLPDVPDLPLLDRLEGEKQTLGLFFSGHPLDLARNRLKARRGCLALTEVLDPKRSAPSWTHIGGYVDEVLAKTNRDRQPWAVLKVSDPGGAAEMAMYAKSWRTHGHLVRSGQAYVFTCRVEEKDGARKLTVEGVEHLPLDAALDRPAPAVRSPRGAPRRAVPA